MLRILLVFTFLAAQAQAYLAINPSWVSFGNVQVGGSGQTESVRISNLSGEPVSLRFSDFCDSDFRYEDFDCTRVLPRYAACTVRITFRPRSEGSQSCTIQINSTNGDIDSIRASGRGIE